jgi:hypothetical protein
MVFQLFSPYLFE